MITPSATHEANKWTTHGVRESKLTNDRGGRDRPSSKQRRRSVAPRDLRSVHCRSSVGSGEARETRIASESWSLVPSARETATRPEEPGDAARCKKARTTGEKRDERGDREAVEGSSRGCIECW